MNHPTPAKVRTLDIEGRLVRCIEEPGGKRLWLCDCPKFTERPARHPEGFCGHTAVAIWRCIEDGSRSDDHHMENRMASENRQ